MLWAHCQQVRLHREVRHSPAQARRHSLAQGWADADLVSFFCAPPHVQQPPLGDTFSAVCSDFKDARGTGLIIFFPSKLNRFGLFSSAFLISSIFSKLVQGIGFEIVDIWLFWKNGFKKMEIDFVIEKKCG